MPNEIENGVPVATVAGAVVKEVKLVPRCDGDDIKVWLLMAERVFRKANLTDDDDKVTTILMYLTNQERRAILDLLTAEASYLVIKEALIQRLTPSDEEKIRHLLDGESIGDRTPSQFLRDLKQKGGPLVGEIVIKNQWMRHLPESTRVVLAAHPNESVDTLATMADGIHTMARLSQPTHIPAEQIPAEITPKCEILAAIRGLKTEIDDYKTATRNLGERLQKLEVNAVQQGGQPQRRRSRSRGRGKAVFYYCYYHARYGPKANKCEKPCNYNAENERADSH